MSDRIGLSPVQFHGPFALLHRKLRPISMNHRFWREAMNAFAYRLTAIHRRLDEEIRRELQRRWPDSIRLLRLKKLRFAVKDRLYARMRRKTVRI
jgi:uncharacterized protein YdcH (DUF465 family)